MRSRSNGILCEEVKMSRSDSSNDCKVYVGNLPGDIRKRDLEDIFYKYGKLVDVDLHDRRETPFAFIEFEDPRDADDAIRGRDGYLFDGYKIRVELPRSSPRYTGRGGGRGYYGGGRRDYGRGGSRPSGHKLIITGLPPTGSWQDIKDHFRPAGDVIYANVERDGVGVVEFARYEHAKRAMRDLDDSKFRSHEGESAYIRVSEPNSGGSPSYRRNSRSPSASPRHSPRYHDSPRRRDSSPRRSRSPRGYNHSRRSRSRSN